jgi:gamma-glutamyl:cysteine ligase YbdK (ATP-grasp superfamily)
MGAEVEHAQFSGKDRQAYRAKVRQCLDVFSRMLSEAKFEFDQPVMGLEIELNLVDANANPAMRNAAVLAAIADDQFQTELGQFNIEINVPPREIASDNTAELEASLRASLNQAEARSREVGAHIVMIGMLPTLAPEHLTRESISVNPRYALINEQIFEARGEDLHISIDGPERLTTSADTIAPEAACTSVQLHLQVPPQDYAAAWNAAQCIAGVQLGIGANSPYLFGKHLWAETRIALFEQATDTRPDELKAQGVRPRVWFGERWITSVFDQFEENVRYFPALLPVCDDEDPALVLRRGDTPRLGELRMHNGTIYRWNRPVYDVYRGKPHLRVENRVLPAGPTVVDILANGAFYYGALRSLVEQDRPLWSQMSFAAAFDNFEAGARHGIDAHMFWPGVGEVPATELVLRRLLPMAYEGLAAWGVDRAVSDRLLGIIEQRCVTHQNGAEWQARTFHRIDDQRQPLDRRDSLREMLRRYVDHMHSNEPVHTWPLD